MAADQFLNLPRTAFEKQLNPEDGVKLFAYQGQEKFPRLAPYIDDYVDLQPTSNAYGWDSKITFIVPKVYPVIGEVDLVVKFPKLNDLATNCTYGNRMLNKAGYRWWRRIELISNSKVVQTLYPENLELTDDITDIPPNKLDCDLLGWVDREELPSYVESQDISSVRALSFATDVAYVGTTTDNTGQLQSGFDIVLLSNIDYTSLSVLVSPPSTPGGRKAAVRIVAQKLTWGSITASTAGTPGSGWRLVDGAAGTAPAFVYPPNVYTTTGTANTTAGYVYLNPTAGTASVAGTYSAPVYQAFRVTGLYLTDKGTGYYEVPRIQIHGVASNSAYSRDTEFAVLRPNNPAFTTASLQDFANAPDVGTYDSIIKPIMWLHPHQLALYSPATVKSRLRQLASAEQTFELPLKFFWTKSEADYLRNAAISEELRISIYTSNPTEFLQNDFGTVPTSGVDGNQQVPALSNVFLRAHVFYPPVSERAALGYTINYPYAEIQRMMDYPIPTGQQKFSVQLNFVRPVSALFFGLRLVPNSAPSYPNPSPNYDPERYSRYEKDYFDRFSLRFDSLYRWRDVDLEWLRKEIYRTKFAGTPEKYYYVVPLSLFPASSTPGGVVDFSKFREVNLDLVTKNSNGFTTASIGDRTAYLDIFAISWNMISYNARGGLELALA